MAATPRFPVRMEPELQAILKIESHRAGVNLTEWIRQAIFFRLAYLATVRGETATAEEIVRRFANGGGHEDEE